MKIASTNDRQRYLLNIPFLIGLLLLIVNDHYLKGAFGNWFTGKLSDFAGILILPLFLKFMLKRSDTFSIISTFILFLFWKSPFSAPFIDAYNSITPIAIERVVDYTDFIAFSMLPVAYYVLQHIKDFSFNLNWHPNWAVGILFTVSSFSFIATSQPIDPTLFDGSDISNCCIDPPTVEVVGNGSIFIPNIFTPDNNGINDFFQIVADTGIARIDTFEIRNLTGDTLVFFKENITDISPASGWDGVFNDTIVPARYFYDIIITSTDNVRHRFAGHLCCIPCGMPTGMVRPSNLANCGFATQYNIETHVFDPDMSSFEDLDCFE